MLFFGAVSALLCAHSVAAQEPRIQVVYDAPAECPPVAQFMERVAARAASNAPGPKLVVSVRERAGEFVGELRIGRRESPIERRIAAPTCLEAVDALALVAAMVLEDARARETARTRAAHAHSAKPRKAPPTNAADPAPRAASLQAEVPTAEDPRSAEAEASASRGHSEPITPPPSSGHAGTAPPRPPAAQPARPSPQRAETAETRFHLDLQLGSLWVQGVAPSPRAGFELGPELLWLRRRLALQANLTLRTTWPYRDQRPEGNVAMSFWAAAAKACAGGDALPTRLRVSACAALEWGTLSARASATENAARSHRPWRAVGPAALIRVSFSARVAAQLGAELLFPLVKDLYTLAESSVFSVPPRAFRMSLALTVRLL